MVWLRIPQTALWLSSAVLSLRCSHRFGMGRVAAGLQLQSPDSAQKEGIVSTMGVLANVAGDVEDADTVAAGVGMWFPTALAGFSFLLFNLLDSPCLAAISTMAKEMQSRKWFWFAIVFQNVFAYAVTLVIYQIGSFLLYGTFGAWTVIAFAVLLFMLFMLFRPDPYKDQKTYAKRSVQAAS